MDFLSFYEDTNKNQYKLGNKKVMAAKRGPGGDTYRASLYVVGSLVFVSGQLPLEDGILKYKGTVGDTLSVGNVIEAAELCALNIIAQLKATPGSLGWVKSCTKVTGFVNAIPSFTEHPRVINGTSYEHVPARQFNSAT